jgi:hypothetical protein
MLSSNLRRLCAYGGRSGQIPPDEPTVQNPPDGAVVDYFLGKDASGPVTLEILDAQSKVVRRFASTDKPEVSAEDLSKQLIPVYWIRRPKALSAGAGMHRWVWDLHYARQPLLEMTIHFCGTRRYATQCSAGSTAPRRDGTRRNLQ